MNAVVAVVRVVLMRLGRRLRPRRGEVGFVVFMAAIITVLFIVRVSNLPGAGDADPPGTGAPTGKYAFVMTTADGKPVTYDPCRPIHYVVNPVGMPAGGLELVRKAIQEISAASGLAFAEDGVTLESLVEDREPRQPERYGNRWAPVLIGWADEASFPPVSGDTVGVAHSSVVAPDGPGSERYVTGQVALDRDWFAEAVTHPGGEADARAVVMHELGHLVGLDHVRDPGELMTESASKVTELGPGDRQGLAAVGAGRCWTDS